MGSQSTSSAMMPPRGNPNIKMQQMIAQKQMVLQEADKKCNKNGLYAAVAIGTVVAADVLYKELQKKKEAKKDA